MEMIGEGPVATVYAEGETALKVYPEPFGRDVRARLDQELAALNVVGETAQALVPSEIARLPDGRPAIRSELCAQSLAELVEHTGALPADDVTAIGLAVAAALAAAHEAGLVHGGVHPANLLFRATGEPLVSDFGVALRRAFPRDVLRGLEFTAPETARDGTLDERTDLYGLGAILYFALTGEPPLVLVPGQQPGERILRLLHEPAPEITRPDLPPGLGALVQQLLAKNPEDRPVSAAAVLAVLDPPLDSPLDSRLDSPPQPPREPRLVTVYSPAEQKPKKDSKLGLVLGIAAALALLAIAPIVLLAQTSPDEPEAQAGGVVVPAPAVSQPTPSRAFDVKLAVPEDRGEQVVLRWTATSALDFFVIVAVENEPTQSHYARRDREMTVPVTPGKQYCFQIQATDGNQVEDTPPMGIRGAQCKDG